MTPQEIIALVMMTIGALFTLAGAIGTLRFPDALTVLHGISIPQTIGLALILGGVVVVQPTLVTFAAMLVVLLAQMMTMPAASTMLGRAAFRRGLVHGSRYVIDDLTPRLARKMDQDDDEDGFVDEVEDSGVGEPPSDDSLTDERVNRFPVNRFAGGPRGGDLSTIANWDEPEPRRDPREDMDIDPDAETGEVEPEDPFDEVTSDEETEVEAHEADPDEVPATEDGEELAEERTHHER
ncbi:MAG: monovalent cation/H(+) antiporter subunit G [Brachybacterium sp.]|nr:monovalent cation/H(+) antiporter subunit G [Brachybacterium sp.]